MLGGILIGAGTTAPNIFLITGLASLGAAVAVFATGRFTPGSRSSRGTVPSKAPGLKAG